MTTSLTLPCIMNCGGCGTDIPQCEDSLQCTVNGCQKTFHLLCVGEKTQSVSEWVCPECRCSTKRGGDNSLTPVGASKKHRDTNVTLRKKISSSVQADEDLHKPEYELLSVEIRSLRQEVASLRNELGKAVSLITSYGTKLADYASQFQSIHTALKTREPQSVAMITASCPLESSRSSLTASSCPVTAPVSCPLGTRSVPPALTTRNLTATVTSRFEPCEAALPPSSYSIATKTGICPPESSKVASEVGVGTSNTAKRRKGKQTTQQVLPASQASTALCPQDLEAQPQWTEVRRSRRPPSLCGTAGPSITTLKAVEPRSYIHLWNMESNADDVSEYLRHLCPAANCTVQELTPKGNYKSYKIGVPDLYRDKCLSIEVWPVNARIKAWVNYRPQSQPFRGRPSRGASAAAAKQ